MSYLHYNNLFQTVINNSVCKDWFGAVLEWEIVDCVEDDELQSSCICGKEDLRYLYTIQNSRNGNILFPIGSSCIRKFKRDDMNESASVRKGMFTLLHAIEDQSYITLSTNFFSRKLLGYLYEKGAFTANKYNDFCPENDYDFLIEMFNKRDKNSITLKQQSKINAIILASIRPYLTEQLKDKIS